MKLFVREEPIYENDYTFLYQSSPLSIQEKIEQIMQERGYVNKGDFIFEKGNSTLRLLLGAFYKHYKMQFAFEALPEGLVCVSLNKKSTGFAGGAIGINQIQKELRAIKEILVAI